jgi:hypothetical protein
MYDECRYQYDNGEEMHHSFDLYIDFITNSVDKTIIK